MLAALLFAGIGSAKAQVTQEWVRRFNGPGNGQDWGNSVEVDAVGNVYVNGCTDSQSGYDYTTIKYSPAGDQLWLRVYHGINTNMVHNKTMVINGRGDLFLMGRSGPGWGDYTVIKYNTAGDSIWTRFHGGQYTDTPHALTCDEAGNVYVTGSQTASDGHDCITVKYSRDGDLVWANSYGNPDYHNSGGYGVAVDSLGNAIVYAYSDQDMVTIKFNSSGQELWARRYDGGSFFDSANPITVDVTGNIYVCGEYNDVQLFVIKYTPDGDTAWVRRYLPPGGIHSTGQALAVDDIGNIHVTGLYGWMEGQTFRVEYLTVKYSPAGDTCWTRIFDGPMRADDYPYDIALDKAGNVYVAGTIDGHLGPYSDYCVLKYSPFGDLIWNIRYGGPGHDMDHLVDLAIDLNMNVYVTGGSQLVNQDIATVKYSQGYFDAVDDPAGPLAGSAIVLRNYPNPFNFKTTVVVSGHQKATIGIFDITGKRVATLQAENGAAVWDGGAFSSGIYFALPAGERSAAIKLILLK
jgi:hypothetical protein